MLQTLFSVCPDYMKPSFDVDKGASSEQEELFMLNTNR